MTTAAVLLMFSTVSTAAYADSAGFRTEQTLVSTAKTAYEGKYTNVQWQTEKNDETGVPVPYGDSVLLPSGKKLLRLSEENGFELAAITLPEAACTDYSGVMTGDTLIQPTKSGLCAIDFTNGDITAHQSFDGSVDSDVAVTDGLAFFSVKQDDSETFYCVDITDMSVKCSYTADADITSATIQGGYVIFGAGENLVTCGIESGTFTEIPVGGEITSAPFATEYAIFFAMSDSIAKLRLDPDGTMEEDTLTLCETGSSTAAPVVYDSKLYTVSDSGFHILDSLNMEITDTLPDIKSGTAPIITLGTGTRIYTVGSYDTAYALYCVFDAGEEYDLSFTALAGLENFSGGTICVSDSGTMYLRDAYGRLFATTRVEYDIVGIVIKLVILALLIAGVFIWIRLVAKRRAESYPKY